MVKEYWNINKKSYYILIALFIAFNVYSHGFLDFFMEYAGLEYLYGTEEIIINEIGMASQVNGIILIGILSFVLGMVALGYGLFQFYVIIKPFKEKQLQQTMLLGNNPRKYLNTHIIFVLVICVLDVVSSLLYNVEPPAGEMTKEVFSILQQFSSGIVTPLWLMCIPLTVMSGNILTDSSSKKRFFIIAFSYLALWSGLHLVNIVPNIVKILNVELASGVADGNIGVTITPQIGWHGMLVNIVGVIAFLLAYKNFNKTYEVK